MEPVTFFSFKRARDFQAQMLRAAMQAGWPTSVERDTARRWMFPGALLYSVSLVTTVGKRLMHSFSTKKKLKLISVTGSTDLRAGVHFSSEGNLVTFSLTGHIV